MPIGSDTYVTYSRLPHLAKPGKTFFVTFCTYNRFVLPPAARFIVLDDCKRLHERVCWFDIVTVMPDHVHFVVTPFDDGVMRLIVGQIKGRNSRLINQLFERRGRLWQRESFDHILRNDESRFAKAEYIRNNPVRAGLVKNPDDYPWTWMPRPAR
ncbi:MAG TPA: transposase [Thermoanaerobaculia bacterium]|nr:transposase [Thermoanaerobaculia bacterium]